MSATTTHAAPATTAPPTTCAGPPLRCTPEPHLLAALWRWADREPERALLAARDGQRFRTWTAAEIRSQIRVLAAGLIGLGVARGDRVVLLASTRREWVLLDHAILATGAVTVPVYPTASASQLATILTNSGARVALVETAAHRSLLTTATTAATAATATAETMPAGHVEVLTIDDGALTQLEKAGHAHHDEVDARIDALRGEDLAAVLYSSGTTGEPKGCELTHANLTANVRQTVAQVPELFTDPARTLVFLPLAHALGRIQVHASLDQGVLIAVATDLDHLAEELAMVRPTFLVVVPRLLEKVLAGARNRAQDAGRAAVFDRAMAVAEQVSQGRRQGHRVALTTRVAHRVLDRLVYRRLRAALGGEVGAVICGGAALATEIAERFDGVGIPILEGYGATETAPIVSGGPFAPLRHGTVGRPYPATTVRIAADGEVLVQGPQVFRGYRGDAAATAEVLRDGWYHTGDLGTLDGAGHLRIVGRKKDLLITAGGKNVVPGPLEDRVRTDPLVEECVVVGEGRPFVAALIWLDPVQVERLCAAAAPAPASPGSAAAEQLLRTAVDRIVAAANRTVSRAESIARYTIITEPLSLDAGSLTPTAKVRRGVVQDRYAAQIDALYATDGQGRR